MQREVMVAGFGGQGILLLGNLLAVAGMRHGLHATFLPVYGPEMRGGTANCTVVLADEEIASPLVSRPGALIAMNRPSLEKFGPRVRPGDGLVVVNTSLADPALAPAGPRVVCVPAGDLAAAAGDIRLANMAALGAFVAASGVLPLQTVAHSLAEVVPGHYAHLLPMNAMALEAGARHVHDLAHG